jgi:hypothetical protein
MSVHELKALARKHWAERLPEKVKELKGAANLAQTEIEHLMRQGYQEHEAREVALPKFILLKPEKDVPDELAEELAEMEREHQKNPPYQSLMGQSEIEPDGEWEEALRQLRLRNQAEKDKAKPSQPMSAHPASPPRSKVPARSPLPSEHEAIWDKASIEGLKELLAEKKAKA